MDHTSTTVRACALAATVATLLSGCATTTGSLAEEGPNALRWIGWPPEAMFIIVEISCACPGQAVLLGGKLHANWTDDPAQDGPTSDVRGQTHAEWFQWTVYQDQDDPRITGHARIWSHSASAVVPASTYTVMADAGTGPSVEATVLQAARGGVASVTYAQAFPLVVPLDGQDLRLLMVASNVTGLRGDPHLDLTIQAPKTAQVTTWAGGKQAFAYDEPSFGRGQGVDVRYPTQLHARNFGPTEMVVESNGTLVYGFVPWTPTHAGYASATYTIEAMDHAYRARYTSLQENSSYECLEGCDGLGMSYALDSGFAPPGRTTFGIEQARCVSQDPCRATIVGFDLGDTKRVSWDPTRDPDAYTRAVTSYS